MRRVALVLLLLFATIGVAIGLGATIGRAQSVTCNPSPSSGAAGTSITINGSGFSGTPTVTFGSASATATVVSSSQIQVVVPTSPLPPPGTGSVPLVVIVAGASVCSGTFTYTTGGGGGAAAFSGITYIVAPNGSDTNSCVLPTSGSADPGTFACGTIQGAIDKTRDRDQVLVLPGVYDIAQPIEVPDLIQIFAAASTSGTPAAVTTGTTGGQITTQTAGCTGTGIKIILRSSGGLPIFHVTGAGSPTLFPVVSGFILGGSVSLANPGAIQLDGASYAQVLCNIIGQEDLPNGIGILLRDADNVFIHDNTIHGSSQFPISASLGPTPPVGGFGIVTSECLGSGHSDDALILNNLVALNSNAGIYFCSDGAGGHVVLGNTIRGNGRGLVLQDANDLLVVANAIQDNYYNGIELLDTSADNILTNNSIESQDGPDATGILLEGNGTLFPLDNAIVNNFFRRNSTNIYIMGARRTLVGIDKFVTNTIEGKFGPVGHVYLTGSGNVLTADGSRTDIVLSLGNPNGQSLSSASPGFGQPSDTIIKNNTILSNGPCGATSGCAIRLTAGVIANVDATSNEWGVTTNDQIRAGIWDKFRDASLGQVVTYCAYGATVPNGGNTMLCPAPTNVAVGPTPVPVAPAIASTPQVAATVIPAQGVGASALPVFTPQPAAGAPTTPPPPPTAYIDPATGNYYVGMTVCVTDSANRPVPNDQLALMLSGADGGTLGAVTVTTGTNGCFVGDVGASGGAAQVLPASLSITDPSGAVTNLAVSSGSPAYRPPPAAIMSS